MKAGPEKNAYLKAYYQKNKAALLEKARIRAESKTNEEIAQRAAYLKEYQEKNKDVLLPKQRTRNSADYQKNKDAYIARSKRWKEENPERVRELDAAYRLKNSEKLRATSAEWYVNNKARAATSARRSKLASFGMTPESYAVMLEAQNHVCAICQTNVPVAKKASLHIDHCHATGKVRGLLCHHCNVGLGAFKDNVEFLMKAAGYLTK